MLDRHTSAALPSSGSTLGLPLDFLGSLPGAAAEGSSAEMRRFLPEPIGGDVSISAFCAIWREGEVDDDEIVVDYYCLARSEGRSSRDTKTNVEQLSVTPLSELRC